MTWISIPEKWTGKQALGVVEFLDEISAMIWSKHELKMLDAYHERFESDDHSVCENQRSPDVEFPF